MYVNSSNNNITQNTYYVRREFHQVYYFCQTNIMGRIGWFFVVCVISIPMFTYEIINTFVDENYRNFQFFTVITNFLTWLYFIMKGIYVLCKYLKTKKSKDVPTQNRSDILLCPTDKMGYFLDAYSIFTTINMLLVCAVFWAMLASTTVSPSYT